MFLLSLRKVAFFTFRSALRTTVPDEAADRERAIFVAGVPRGDGPMAVAMRRRRTQINENPHPTTSDQKPMIEGQRGIAVRSPRPGCAVSQIKTGTN